MKKINNMIRDTDSIMDYCGLLLIASQDKELEIEEFKDFLTEAKDIYSKYFADCKLVESNWKVLKASLDASLDLLELNNNEVTQSLLEICLFDIYQNIENIAEKIKKTSKKRGA